MCVTGVMSGAGGARYEEGNMKTIICGPQGCGKTSKSPLFARVFGVSVVIDEWDGRSPLPEDCLALTSADDVAADGAVRVLSFDAAMAIAGAESLAA